MNHPTDMRELVFVRHGETEFNRRGERCGGDIDPVLTERGEEQAHALGERLRSLPPFDTIFTGPLARTRRTAAIVATYLAPCPIIELEGLRERRLGAWNGQLIAETEISFAPDFSPPGGEDETTFRNRVASVLSEVLSLDRRRPLIVSSKGVGRVLGSLAGTPPTTPLGNADIARFVFPASWAGPNPSRRGNDLALDEHRP